MNGLTTTTPAAVVPLGISADTRENISKAKAERTLRGYASDLRDFNQWAQDNGRAQVPTDSEAICDYVSAMAKAGAAVATIERRLASLSRAHKMLGASNPARAELVKLTFAGVRKVKGSAQRQKAALRIEDLRAICHTLPDDLRGKRDRAILTMLFAGAMRRSELASLTRANTRILPDELLVTLGRTKTDQEGRGTTKRMPRLADAAICPHRALNDWLSAAGIKAGPLFRGLTGGTPNKSALCDRAIADVVKARARAAGLDGDYGGHSGRSGFVTSAFDAGVSEADIMAVTDHKSVTMLRKYRRVTGAEAARAVRAVMGG